MQEAAEKPKGAPDTGPYYEQFSGVAAEIEKLFQTAGRRHQFLQEQASSGLVDLFAEIEEMVDVPKGQIGPFIEGIARALKDAADKYKWDSYGKINFDAQIRPELERNDVPLKKKKTGSGYG